MSDFHPIITNDGSLSLYNNVINDIYHSSAGAYSEAMSKFVVPCGIRNFALNNNEISILDACYGLGYNSKAAVNEIIKVNPKCKINVDCIEIDPKVLALSCLYTFYSIDSFINNRFSNKIYRNALVQEQILNLSNDVTYADFINYKNNPFLKRLIFNGLNYIKISNRSGSLHNIYYRSITKRNIKTLKTLFSADNINISFHITDLRKAIIALNLKYDFIFHDAFTPSKQPSLWSVDLFKLYYSLLKQNGIFATYSSALPVRNGLIEAGFYIGRNVFENNKSIGTLAVKNPELIKHSLTSKDTGLLDTKAGIPYYDVLLNLTDADILENRRIMINNSNKISSSRFLKNNKH